MSVKAASNSKMLIPWFSWFERHHIAFPLWALTLLVFLLSHSNQRSSQSLASLLLLLAPVIFFTIPRGTISALPKPMLHYALFGASVFLYSLIVFIHNPVSEVAFNTMRALTFYLLAPLTIVLIWSYRPSKRAIFVLLFLACGFSLYPIINDILTNQSRGNSSAHPIFWGNICLTTAVATFVISKDRDLYIPYAAFFGFAALSAAGAASFWSLTRGGWISIPIVLILLTAIRVISWRQLLLLCAILIMVVASSDRIQQRVAKTIHWDENGLHFDGSTQLRWDMWSVSFEAFKENPIMGNGLDAFARMAHQKKTDGDINFYFNHAHNEYWDVLASRGMLGLILLVSWLSWLMAIYWRHRHSFFARAGIATTIQFTLYSLSEIFFSTKSTLVYFLILQSLLLYACLQDRSHTKGNAPCIK